MLTAGLSQLPMAQLGTISCHWPALLDLLAVGPPGCAPTYSWPKFHHQPSLLCAHLWQDPAAAGMHADTRSPVVASTPTVGPWPFLTVPGCHQYICVCNQLQWLCRHLDVALATDYVYTIDSNHHCLLWSLPTSHWTRRNCWGLQHPLQLPLNPPTIY